MIKVTFTDGETQLHDADSATLDGPVFVLRKRIGGSLQSVKTFPAYIVVMAELPNGNIALGAGKLQS